MELSANAEKIISQADKWTFEGDCSLLQWMENIAQSLEERSNTTNQALEQLSSNLKRTSTGLDNVTNSLAALQYTQFVENRCHDDDETIANVAEVPVDIDKSTQESVDINELWKNFMKKNLEVLHNCHESYSIDFEDSDEDDTTDSFVYQAKNPYNERLLPHIYGSNLWKENWHVGLCDGSNEYSGDDNSEAFSESSSITSPEDNESSESTDENISEWTSSTSITNEKQLPHLKIQNASSLRDSLPLFPEETTDPVGKITAGSDTSSSTSRNTSNQILTGYEQYQPHYDLFAPIQDTPPTSTSSSSSLHQQFSTSAKSNINSSKDFLNDNIEQAPTVRENILPSVSSNHIRRRPVNLFDDDDFNNFMSEIVDKVNQKPEQQPTVPPVPAARKQMKIKEQEIKTSTNLFNEQNPSGLGSIPSNNKIETMKKKTLNLFDDGFDILPPKTDTFGTASKVPPVEIKSDIQNRITAKSLFDDDDEDDDFLNIFAKKKENTKNPIEKTLLFNDDEPKDTEHLNKNQTALSNNNLLKNPSIKSIDVFAASPPLFHDEFQNAIAVPRTGIDEVVKQQEDSENFSKKKQAEYVQKEIKSNTIESFKNTSTTAKINNDTLPNKVDTNLSNKSLSVSKTVNLFDDDDNDDDDIFLSAKVKTLMAANKVAHDQISIGNEVKPIVIEDKIPTNISFYDNGLKTVKEDFNETEKQINSIQSVNSEQFQHAKDKSLNSIPSNLKNQNQSSLIHESGLTKHFSEKAEDIKQISDNFLTNSKDLEDLKNVIETTPALCDDTIQKTEQIRKLDEAQELAQSSDNEINTEVSTFDNKTPNTYTGLFLDEPPEDDEAFFQSLDNSISNSKFSQDLEADYYEPDLPKLPTEPINASKVPIYSSVGLFSDIPPDDDLEDVSVNKNNNEIKRIHSVFYDDFNETLEAVNKMPIEVPKNLQNIFSDEPPSDNEDDFKTFLQSANKKEIVDTTNFAKETEEFLPQCVLDKGLPLSSADDKENMEDNQKVKVIPHISKLQMPKININVHALLPQSVEKTTIVQSIKRPIENVMTDNSSFLSSPAVGSTTTYHENILVSVCKNRVRAPAKRRPSTRRARQDNYQKSLIAEQDISEDEEETKQKFEENQKCKKQYETKQLQQEISKQINTSKKEVSLFKNNATAEIRGTIETEKIFTNTSFLEEHIEKQNINVDNANKSFQPSGGLFDAFENKDEDYLFSSKTPSQFKVTSSREEISKTVLDKNPTSLSTNAKSLQVQSKIAATSEITNLPKNLFLPNNESEKTENLIFDTKKKLTLKETPVESLFADEGESDSDDLFGTKNVSQTKNTSTTATVAQANIVKVTTLFSSDEEEVNDKKLRKIFKKPVTTKTFLRKSTGNEDKALFSDTDDDDNLFGSKTITTATSSKTNIGCAKPAQNPVSVKQKNSSLSKTTISTTKTTDNPLADLLNN